MESVDTKIDSSEVALERKRREVAEEQLKQTQRELAEYKARVQSLSANQDQSKSLSALTGSFRVTSLGDKPRTTQENLSELTRKASTLFSQNPSSKELKILLRELIISGDEKAKLLASRTTVGNSSELIAYLKEKREERSGTELLKRKEISEKERARARELAELRAEGGVSMNDGVFNNSFGFNSLPATPNATPDSQKKAQQRFASKRERPQSYGNYIKTPSLNKTKMAQPVQPTLQPGLEPKPVFQGLQSMVDNGRSSGLLNLNDLTTASSAMEVPQFHSNPMLGLQTPPNTGFGLLNPMNAVLQSQYAFQTQNSAFGGFGMPFGQLNPQYINNMPQVVPPTPTHVDPVNSFAKQSSFNSNILSPEMGGLPPPTPIKKLVPKVEPDIQHKITKQPPRRWTEKEDELLRNSVKKYGARNWKNIATEVPGRNHVQCLQRWRKALDPKVVKGHWSPEEDAKLLKLVELNPKNWGHVARGIDGRTAKQCRERFHNHLDPSIKKGNWAFDEDKLIVLLQKQLGNKWAEIAKKLDGRTENSVKIRWKSIKRQVIALKEESQNEEKNFLKRRIKRNTMDRERLDKLLMIWDFTEQ